MTFITRVKTTITFFIIIYLPIYRIYYILMSYYYSANVHLITNNDFLRTNENAGVKIVLNSRKKYLSDWDVSILTLICKHYIYNDNIHFLINYNIQNYKKKSFFFITYESISLLTSYIWLKINQLSMNL